jgi:Trypsin-like peptidase domain
MFNNALRLLTTTTALLTPTATLEQSTTSGSSPGTTAVVAPPSGSTVEFDRELSGPHVLDTPAGEVIVRIQGSGLCSGTPLTGTKFVVTAAHCVLDENGAIDGHTRVLRDGIEYTPVSVLVNPEYHNSPSPLLDPAVLVMNQIIPGPSATLADQFPTQGLVTVAGLQPLDTDGSLLRGTRPDNRPLPGGAEHGIFKIATAVAGCIHLTSDAEVTDDHVRVPCGLIPGASGGGLFVEHNGELILAGIISTVAQDLTYNELVPLTALHQMLDNPIPYTHNLTAEADNASFARVGRS